ncbi:hypothetical protein BRYFOR_07219 [Marvinbryantia formatexigens DSM 14469]|uniref:Uncharacterized protein n=1 Tax=Marvinbryantia formatexigens DSM 14469 TaxID=478749 RepID=C6LF18_9FIRM|nr:hypothetical protein BRYFOR_07219 [Marvinbryantia formatexigens DSM 14469]
MQFMGFPGGESYNVDSLDRAPLLQFICISVIFRHHKQQGFLLA